MKILKCSCGKIIKKKYLYGNEFLCYHCYMKHFTVIPGIYPSNKIKIEDAINKIRIVRVHLNKKGTYQCSISVPSCYAGKKVKVVIIE
jgi:hypothetical protein